MSFFGFEQTNRLQEEKRRFLEAKGEQEDLAIYTWGEDSYDGLSSDLLERGDELNDETFGGTGEVGKFLFSNNSLSLTYDAQTRTLISHSNASRLMYIPGLSRLNPPPSSKLFPSPIRFETRHRPVRLRALLRVRSSQS
jgi:hypothetical protein